MPLETENLTPRIGVEIKADAATMLGGAFAKDIRKLLDERGVIVVRGLHFDDEELVAFARTLGEIHGTHTGEVFKVTLNDKENPQMSRTLYRTVDWHMDRMDSDLPPLGSMLTPRVLPPWGGETEFTNTYAAFEDLPEDKQRYLEGIEVLHTMSSHFGEDRPRSPEEMPPGMVKPPEKVHPLVWHHRSGRKSLVLGMTMFHVVGMEQKESTALIRRLVDWASKPAYVYRHEWQMGDLVIWDNTGTMHRVRPYDESSGRQLHRVTLVGEEPIAGV